jgi:hypothetical protein
MGYGDATRPTLLSGSNVELFATLTGKRSLVAVADEAARSDPDLWAAEARLEKYGP